MSSVVVALASFWPIYTNANGERRNVFSRNSSALSLLLFYTSWVGEDITCFGYGSFLTDLSTSLNYRLRQTTIR